jgi:hypothetical protein
MRKAPTRLKSQSRNLSQAASAAEYVAWSDLSTVACCGIDGTKEVEIGIFGLISLSLRSCARPSLGAAFHTAFSVSSIPGATGLTDNFDPRSRRSEVDLNDGVLSRNSVLIPFARLCDSSVVPCRSCMVLALLLCNFWSCPRWAKVNTEVTESSSAT